MEISRVLATEMRLLEPICEFIEEPGYTVFRSSAFRNYYGGNGIALHEPLGRSLAEWEETFRSYFDPTLYEHTTFLFPRSASFSGLIEQAEAEHYHVTFDTYMFAESCRACQPLPADLVVRRVESEEEWKRVGEFYSLSYPDGDWFDPESDGPDRLFEKTRVTSEAIGGEWFYLLRSGESELLASLGMFEHGGVCRLQDVETSPKHRRQGLATALVGFALDRALNTLGSAGLALCADSDYHAVDLYRKLGFVEVGAAVTLMKYPIRNPRFLQG